MNRNQALPLSLVSVAQLGAVSSPVLIQLEREHDRELLNKFSYMASDLLGFIKKVLELGSQDPNSPYAGWKPTTLVK